MCVCVCIHTHTHTHTHKYIDIYIADTHAHAHTHLEEEMDIAAEELLHFGTRVYADILDDAYYDLLLAYCLHVNSLFDSH